MRVYAGLFFLVMFMIGTDTFLVAPLLPTLQAEFGVSTRAAGWIVGAYTLGSAVFALVAGPLSDGWNRRTVMLRGMVCFALATMLCGFADSFWAMCAFRFLAGAAAAFTAPQVWASIPAVMPAGRVPATMGLAFSGLAASQALGVPIGSWLAAGHWSVPFWMIGCAALLLAVALFAALPDIKPSAEQGAGGAAAIFGRYATLAKSGKARSRFLAYFLLHLGSGSAFAFIGKWMSDRFELSVGPIGAVMMFLGIGTLLGSLVSAHAARRLGRARTFASGMLLVAALYAAGPALPTVAAAAAGYVVIFAALGILFPIAMESLTSLNAAVRGTISSLANSTMNAANTVGAWAAGMLYAQYGGYASVGVFAAACLVLSLASFRVGGLPEGDYRKNSSVSSA